MHEARHRHASRSSSSALLFALGHGAGVHRRALAAAVILPIGSTSGDSPDAASGRSSPGFSLWATSTRPTPSSPCRRWCSAPARFGFFCLFCTPCSSTRLCSSSFPRLWSRGHKHGYITASDFIHRPVWLAGLWRLRSPSTGYLSRLCPGHSRCMLVGIEGRAGGDGISDDRRLWLELAADHRIRDSGGVYVQQLVCVRPR